MDHIRSREEFTGLQINQSQCEIISRSVATQIAQFNNFVFLAPDEAELLRAPLFPGTKVDAALSTQAALDSIGC